MGEPGLVATIMECGKWGLLPADCLPVDVAIRKSVEDFLGVSCAALALHSELMGTRSRIESKVSPDLGESIDFHLIYGVEACQGPAFPLAVGQPDHDSMAEVMLGVACLFEADATVRVSVVVTDQEDTVE
jgi:hypothetical protein